MMILARALTILASVSVMGAASPPDAGQPPAQALPSPPRPRSAKVILADSIAATGGAAAWRAHKTVHLELTVGLQGMGMGGPAEHFQTRTNKSLTVTTMPGVGEIREGSDGKRLWTKDPVSGLRFLTGAEAEQARIEASWNADIQATALYKKIETAADPPAGQECLTLTPRLGPAIRNCYDAGTHLQVSQEGTRTTAQGDVPFQSKISDWRLVGGIKIPYVTETQAGPVTIVTTVTDVAFDEPMSNKMFRPPARPAH
jgi:hypothetical protein